MAIDDLHPAYIEVLPDWELLTDCDAGERVIKSKGETYLPPTNGMRASGFGVYESNGKASLGQAAYDAYKMRAVFHDFVHEAVAGLRGIMHRKPPTYENIPALLEDMMKSATIAGESMDTLWQRISELQLGHGRCGLLVDVPNGKEIDEAVPYIAIYGAMAIINWDVGQRQQGRQKTELVVLDETAQVRQEDLSWKLVRQFRILSLTDTAMAIGSTDQAPAASGTYVVAVASDVEVKTDKGEPTGQNQLVSSDYIAPAVGGKTLDEIPFVFINVNDVTAPPDRPPLLGLANIAMAIYRGEADYRQSLFMTGQDTIARIGATEAQRISTTIGAGGIIDVQMGGDVKYIGVSGVGLAEQRQALENDKMQASAHAIQLLDTSGGEDQSGEALRVRVSAKTATLTSMQKTAATAIRDALILAGRWLGVSDAELEKIEVKPNLEFSDAKQPPEAIGVIMTAKMQGLPLSNASIHSWLVRNGYTMLTLDEEEELLAQERTDMADAANAAGLDIDPLRPNDPSAARPKVEEIEDEDEEIEEGGPPKKRPPFGG